MTENVILILRSRFKDIFGVNIRGVLILGQIDRFEVITEGVLYLYRCL